MIALRKGPAPDDIWLNPILLHWPFPSWKRPFCLRPGPGGFMVGRRGENLIFVVIHGHLKQASCGIDKEYLRNQRDDRRKAWRKPNSVGHCKVYCCLWQQGPANG